MRYGFVIDHRKCIGCHACTVACKEENRVPLGAFRTWVKYVEKGTFPHTRRYFSVLRCNHCDDAPCVTICPTVALYRRSDGVVDFDGVVDPALPAAGVLGAQRDRVDAVRYHGTGLVAPVPDDAVIPAGQRTIDEERAEDGAGRGGPARSSPPTRRGRPSARARC